MVTSTMLSDMWRKRCGVYGQIDYIEQHEKNEMWCMGSHRLYWMTTEEWGVVYMITSTLFNDMWRMRCGAYGHINYFEWQQMNEVWYLWSHQQYWTTWKELYVVHMVTSTILNDMGRKRCGVYGHIDYIVRDEKIAMWCIWSHRLYWTTWEECVVVHMHGHIDYIERHEKNAMWCIRSHRLYRTTWKIKVWCKC